MTTNEAKEVRACHYCDRSDVELRPYGPGGSWLCFKCLKESPEREEAAGRMFMAQLDACGPVAVLNGSEVGPYPVDRSGDN